MVAADNAVLALRLQKPIDAEVYLLAKPVLDIEKMSCALKILILSCPLVAF